MKTASTNAEYALQTSLYSLADRGHCLKAALTYGADLDGSDLQNQLNRFMKMSGCNPFKSDSTAHLPQPFSGYVKVVLYRYYKCHRLAGIGLQPRHHDIIDRSI